MILAIIDVAADKWTLRLLLLLLLYHPSMQSCWENLLAKIHFSFPKVLGYLMNVYVANSFYFFTLPSFPLICKHSVRFPTSPLPLLLELYKQLDFLALENLVLILSTNIIQASPHQHKHLRICKRQDYLLSHCVTEDFLFLLVLYKKEIVN